MPTALDGGRLLELGSSSLVRSPDSEQQCHSVRTEGSRHPQSRNLVLMVDGTLWSWR
jgi:hypothetical protein